MINFKVGDKVEILDKTRASSLRGSIFSKGDTGYVVRVECGYYVVARSKDNTNGDFFAESDLKRAGFQVGDTIVGARRVARIVIATFMHEGEEYAVTKYRHNGMIFTRTVSSLMADGYKIEEPEVELTLAEIADKFEIDVAKLRIKE